MERILVVDDVEDNRVLLSMIMVSADNPESVIDGSIEVGAHSDITKSADEELLARKLQAALDARP